MKFVVGLGNPGKKFRKTRHNVGFVVLDSLARELAGARRWRRSKRGKLTRIRIETSGGKAELIKPQTFMNQSGLAVLYVKKKHPEFRPSFLLVVNDYLDLELGAYKLQLGRGPKDHRGLLSVEQALEAKGFWRLRVGVDNREFASERRTSGQNYVLRNFKILEWLALKGLVERKLKGEVKEWLADP